MIIKIQYSFSNNETLYMHKVSTRKLSSSQLENLKFGIIKRDQQTLSSPYENPQRKSTIDDKIGNIDENLGYVSLRQCVRMLVASSPELFKIDNFVISNDAKLEGNGSETLSNNSEKKDSHEKGKTDLQSSHSRNSNKDDNNIYQNDKKEQSLTLEAVPSFNLATNMNRVIDYSVYNKDFLEIGNPLTGHGSMKRLLSTKKLLKSKLYHNQHNIKSNNAEILKDVNHDNLIVGQFLKTSNFLFKDTDVDNEGNESENGKKDKRIHNNNDQTRMLNRLTLIFQNDKYSLIVKLKFIEYTRDLNYKYDFNLVPSEIFFKLLSNSNNQIRKPSPSHISKSHLHFTLNHDDDNKLKAPKASRTLSLPVFNQDTFDPNKQKIIGKRKSKLHTNGLRALNDTALIATRTSSMISAPLTHSNYTSSPLTYELEENDSQLPQHKRISSQVFSNSLQFQELVGKNNNENKRNHKLLQSKDEMPPQLPMCVNCNVTKSLRWAWFCGSNNPTLSEKEKLMEGLFCKECHDYYKTHDKLRPQKKKRKSSVSFSDSNIKSSTTDNNGKSKSSFKKAKAAKSTSIAETLAFNRSNMDKKRSKKLIKINKNSEEVNRTDFADINSDNLPQIGSYDNNSLLQIDNIPTLPTMNMNSIVNDPYFQNYEDVINAGQLIAFDINDNTQQNNKWISDLFKNDSNGFSTSGPVEQSGTGQLNNFNAGNIEINEKEIENALLLNSILLDIKNYDGNNTEDKNSSHIENKKKNCRKSNEDELLLMCSSASSSLPSSPGFLEKSQETKQ